MFASLSSFLPSAFQQAAQASRPPELCPPSPTTPQDISVADPPRKKEKKEKHPNEAFIIVRPPPSKSPQPLSLQVQLVLPQSRHDKPLQALDSSPDDLNTDLKRTHSNRSDASTTSGYISGGSVSSFVSTSTSSSGRRTIIPLYNLNVHSVMPTTILDAGTDAKVAKFAKRGLEIIGLAFLEPIEVRPPVAAHGSLGPPINLRTSLDDSLREFGSTLSPRSVLSTRPTSSHAAIYAGDTSKPTIKLTRAPPPPDQPPRRPTKKLFSRVFGKKESASPLSITVPLPDDVTSQPSLLRNNIALYDEAPASQPNTPYHYDFWPSAALASNATSQTAVLGVHSTFYPPVSNPKGRPTKYIWVVRKWLKGSDAGILNGVMGKLSPGARDINVPNTPYIEVRFEWCREQKKGSVRKSRSEKPLNPRDPARLGTANSTLPRFASQVLAPDARDYRSSIVSHDSFGSDIAPSLVSCSAHQHAESDEESDPEDSETPWTCTVAVQRVGQPAQHQNGGQESAIRLKVATLAPTPHHPKIVGLLKIPFPLPDIEVEQLAVRRRHVTTHGVSKTASFKAGELILTAEEIKDSVSSTALWLVVREAFGGVGRERRRGL